MSPNPTAITPAEVQTNPLVLDAYLDVVPISRFEMSLGFVVQFEAPESVTQLDSQIGFNERLSLEIVLYVVFALCKEIHEFKLFGIASRVHRPQHCVQKRVHCDDLTGASRGVLLRTSLVAIEKRCRDSGGQAKDSNHR
jgi:hypothetical protein